MNTLFLLVKIPAVLPIVSVMKKYFSLLVLLCLAAFGYCSESWVKPYYQRGEVITKVHTVKQHNGVILLALEGYHPLTQDFFTRLQAVDLQGNLVQDYAAAYAGEPFTIGAGLFETSDTHLLVPRLEELPEQSFRFRWQNCYPDYNEFSLDEYQLPDSIGAIYEFPSASTEYYPQIRTGTQHRITGRAIVNGIYRTFLLEDGSAPERFFTYIPDLIHISAITPVVDGTLVLGQGSNRSGKLYVVDSEGNQLWQQTISDATDITPSPIFNTPLIAADGNAASRKLISYQNKDRILRLSLYADRQLETIYTEQLDAYQPTVPVIMLDSTAVFACQRKGSAVLNRIDLQGILLWTCYLPGIANFGRNCLSLGSDVADPNGSYILVAGRLANGGYYLAKVNSADGSIGQDEVSQPQQTRFRHYPNPCSDELNLYFELSAPGKVKLDLYNLKGQKVHKLIDADFPRGIYRETLSLHGNISPSLPSGIYLLRLQQDSVSLTRKLIYYSPQD